MVSFNWERAWTIESHWFRRHKTCNHTGIERKRFFCSGTGSNLHLRTSIVDMYGRAELKCLGIFTHYIQRCESYESDQIEIRCDRRRRKYVIHGLQNDEILEQSSQCCSTQKNCVLQWFWKSTSTCTWATTFSLTWRKHDDIVLWWKESRKWTDGFRQLWMETQIKKFVQLEKDSSISATKIYQQCPARNNKGHNLLETTDKQENIQRREELSISWQMPWDWTTWWRYTDTEKGEMIEEFIRAIRQGWRKT